MKVNKTISVETTVEFPVYFRVVGESGLYYYKIECDRNTIIFWTYDSKTIEVNYSSAETYLNSFYFKQEYNCSEEAFENKLKEILGEIS